MQLGVEYIDSSSKLYRKNFQISLPALLKHAGVAGRGPWGHTFGVLPSLARGLGVLLFYHDYFELNWRFGFTGFRHPEVWYHDPTELGDLSTILGRGIADFLAKRLLGAQFTHTYEAAMYVKKMPISGRRPDFYCTTQTQQFAMEAKGFSARSVSSKKMAEHKQQSRTGPLRVNFSVASVTYGLFEKPRCKFHDPILADADFDTNANETLAQLYYSSILEELDTHIEATEFRHGARTFRQYDISPYIFARLGEPRVHLIVDSRANDSTSPFDLVTDKVSEDGLYIDVDGVGVRFD